jgi:ribosomal protein L16 Arg81 hydroxylase
VTTTDSRRVPVQHGRPALSRLVACPADEFAERYWGSEPLLSRAADLPAPFTDLFSNAAVDELVSERGLRTPFLRMAKDGATLPERSFTSGGGIGAGVSDQLSDDRLLRQFADGATMVLQGLHRTWQPVIAFSQDLAADLGHPVQVNAYVTPAQNTGFSDHYDVHDVFVLQVEGRKHWRIRPPVHPLPLRDQPWTDRRAAVEQAATREPLVDAILEPGDCLYLPRGFLHSATALGAVSTHLTIGVHPWTRHHLADEVLRLALSRAAEDVALRRSLPLGTDATEAGEWATDLELVRAAVLRAVGEIDAADLSGTFARRVRDAQRASPVGPLAQLRAAETLAPDGRLRVRPHLAAGLGPVRDGYAVLASRAGDVQVAEGDVQRVGRFLDEGSARVSDLGEGLARRLLVQGIAVMA